MIRMNEHEHGFLISSRGSVGEFTGSEAPVHVMYLAGADNLFLETL